MMSLHTPLLPTLLATLARTCFPYRDTTCTYTDMRIEHKSGQVMAAYANGYLQAPSGNVMAAYAGGYIQDKPGQTVSTYTPGHTIQPVTRKE